MALEQLQDPPIVEVACGCRFPAIPTLDAAVLGIYWEQRRGDFPKHELHPPISDQALFSSLEQLSFSVKQGVPPIRTWLVSQAGEYLVQIQNDRFYVNWRKQGAGAYPRFKSDPKNGVRARALAEFERFREFCRSRLGEDPNPVDAQLTKVDHLTEGPAGRCWRDFNHLAQMVPWLTDFAKFSTSGAPQIAVRFVEPRHDGQVVVALDMLPPTAVNPPAVGRVLKIESTATAVVSAADALGAAFDRINDQVNDVFEKLVPRTTRDQYFQRKVR